MVRPGGVSGWHSHERKLHARVAVDVEIPRPSRWLQNLIPDREPDPNEPPDQAEVSHTGVLRAT